MTISTHIWRICHFESRLHFLALIKPRWNDLSSNDSRNQKWLLNVLKESLVFAFWALWVYRFNFSFEFDRFYQIGWLKFISIFSLLPCIEENVVWRLSRESLKSTDSKNSNVSCAFLFLLLWFPHSFKLSSLVLS